MRYTRYDYRRRQKRGSGGFLMWVILILTLATILGIVVGKKWFDGSFLPTGNNKEPSQPANAQVLQEDKIYYYIQCGYFSKKDNAEATQMSVPSNYSPFTIKDGDKYRVISGIYTEDISSGKSDELTKEGVTNVKTKITLEVKDTVDKAKIEVIDGLLKLIVKVEDKKIEAIKTKEYKDWYKSINLDNKKEEIRQLDKIVDDLPKSLDKDSVKAVKIKLYNYIIKYKK